jgi:class 3 adenylate cyclase
MLLPLLLLLLLLLAELMRINAPLMTRALGLHNVVLRRAAAAQAGHVVEQEGDSWCIAFHSPMDAVAFCLQARASCRPADTFTSRLQRIKLPSGAA